VIGRARPMRFAGDVDLAGALETVTTPDQEAWEQFGAPVAAAASQEQIAMTPAEAKQLLGRFSDEALKGNMTPKAFTNGLFELSQYAKSPDAIRRQIRNNLKSPVGRFVAANPGAAAALAEQNVGRLKSAGVNPEAGKKYIGLGVDLLRQAKKDGLLRPDVTHREIQEKLQRPLYGAMQDFVNRSGSDPRLNQLIRRELPDIKGYDRHGRPLGPLQTLLGDFIR